MHLCTWRISLLRVYAQYMVNLGLCCTMNVSNSMVQVHWAHYESYGIKGVRCFRRRRRFAGDFAQHGYARTETCRGRRGEFMSVEELFVQT